MGQRHKHADVIIAWAEGKDVQARAPQVGEWSDLSIAFPHFHEDWEYRIKPSLKEFRVALFKDTFAGNIYTGTADTTEDANFCEKDRGFVRWLTDWIEYVG